MEIYTPSEDSFLLSKVLGKKLPKMLKKNPGLKFLEIGCGSGIQLKKAKDLGVNTKNIFSCDVNSKAISHCKKIGFNCVKSNLFENIKGKYDVIIFNAPYLPESKYDKKADTTGGKSGSETSNEFLKQAKHYLKDSGRIFLLTSSFTKGLDFSNYKKKKIAKDRLFFEEIHVWELR